MAVPPVSGSPADSQLLGEASILVIDDQPSNVTLLERLLTRVGVGRVVGLTDPRQALAAFRSVQPDLVLLDLHMPHLDGYEVLAALAEEVGPGGFVPVVVLTADATDAAKQAALAAGANDFLTKPFDRTEALLRVRNLLHTRAMHVALQRHNASMAGELHEHREHERREAAARAEKTRRVEEVLAGRGIEMVFQPIVDLETLQVVGAEALARFSALPVRPPNEWFAEAADVGLGADLELCAVRSALAALAQLPETVYLSVNVSPTVLRDRRLADLVCPIGHRVVVELTEHVEVQGYEHLASALGPLQQAGARVAVDDTGSGYASLQHVLRLRPGIIKLDIALVRGIDTDPARRALAAALVSFSREVGCTLVAEGIENPEELATLRRLGVSHGQGFYLGRPGPLAGLEVPGAVLAAS
ncbi:MAG TPA: EAL domain-containing response regulator [Acidimicrobiales bacterium]|nr:EAL domain-containing response regulator [Acidimicrobiales bacterium]